MLSSGNKRVRVSEAIFVCAEMWKLPPLREEVLEERDRLDAVLWLALILWTLLHW